MSNVPEILAVLAEYDAIVANADPLDSEWDFVMRASDWRVIRAAIPIRNGVGPHGEYPQPIPGDGICATCGGINFHYPGRACTRNVAGEER